MALIKSNILSAVSGSMNGITFARNAGGAYIRNRSVPVNPGTDRQDAVRTALTSIASTWKYNLTQAQREAWRNFGANTQVQNRIGETITLSGIAAFQRVNLFRVSTLGQAIVMDAPAVNRPAPPPSFVSATVTNDAGTVEIVVTNNAAGTTNYSIAYYVSGPLSEGIRFYRGPYITLGTIAATAATVDIPTAIDGTIYEDAAQVAAKITLYETATGLPIWTVYLDAMQIPGV